MLQKEQVKISADAQMTGRLYEGAWTRKECQWIGEAMIQHRMRGRREKDVGENRKKDENRQEGDPKSHQTVTLTNIVRSASLHILTSFCSLF